MSSQHRSPRMALAAFGALAALGLSGCITVTAPAAPPSAQPTASQAPAQAASTTTTETAPPAEQHSSDGLTIDLENELGTVFVTVPATWTDVEYGSWADPNGLTFDTILAAPDLARYQESWDASGVEVRGRSQVVPTPLGEMIDEEIEPYLDQCTLDLDQASYEDDYYMGRVSTLEDCAGLGTQYIVFAGYPSGDQSSTIMVVLQIGGNDPDAESVLDTVFNSFDTAGS